jgi:hypothetical protein
MMVRAMVNPFPKVFVFAITKGSHSWSRKAMPRGCSGETRCCS